MSREDTGCFQEPIIPTPYLSALSKDELRALVSEWTLILKSDGLPPERVLVTVKTLVREVVAPLVASYAGTDITADRATVLADASQWCIRAYFDEGRTRHGRAGTVGIGNTVARKSLSRRLLLKLLALRPELPSGTLASRLSVDPRQFAAFASGTQLMPLDVQERLAAFAMKEVVELARLARQLRLQVEAARRYQNGDVVRHRSSPPRMW